VLCVLGGGDPLSCIAAADKQAQLILVDLVACLTLGGCLEGAQQDMLGALLCVVTECGQEGWACISDL
jgi:hypothetical protein